jgi:hypothetical protein
MWKFGNVWAAVWGAGLLALFLDYYFCAFAGGGYENGWQVIWPFLNPEIQETATFILPKDSPFF